ncbi:MAG: hypothetical protein ACKOC8_02805 [Pirellulales bacterium]
MPRSRASTLLTAAVVAAWLTLVAGPPAALLAWRGQRLATLTGPEAQAEWDAFRADMRRQSGRDGPVQRKVPKSAEPPELVWLRDHVPLAVVAWLTLGGVLGGFLAVLVLGVARDRSAAEDQPTGQGDDEEQHQRDAQHTDERRHG